jgi:hypothetical protein
MRLVAPSSQSAVRKVRIIDQLCVCMTVLYAISSCDRLLFAANRAAEAIFQNNTLEFRLFSADIYRNCLSADMICFIKCDLFEVDDPYGTSISALSARILINVEQVLNGGNNQRCGFGLNYFSRSEAFLIAAVEDGTSSNSVNFSVEPWHTIELANYLDPVRHLTVSFDSAGNPYAASIYRESLNPKGAKFNSGALQVLGSPISPCLRSPISRSAVRSPNRGTASSCTSGKEHS